MWLALLHKIILSFYAHYVSRRIIGSIIKRFLHWKKYFESQWRYQRTIKSGTHSSFTFLVIQNIDSETQISFLCHHFAELSISRNGSMVVTSSRRIIFPAFLLFSLWYSDIQCTENMRKCSRAVKKKFVIRFMTCYNISISRRRRGDSILAMI